MNPRPPQIAIVDDEDSVRKALARLLRAAGMEVATFACGSDFLAARPLPAVDALVLDLHMPGASGFEVLEQLGGWQRRPAVIVITGLDTPESQTRALAGGAAAYLLKPVDAQVLLAAIAGALGQAAG